MGRLWQEHFLEQLRNGATVIDAAKAAGVKRATVNEERLRNPEFADRWDEIQANLLEEIENALYRSALAGDTTVAIFIAKAKLGWTDGPGEHVSDAPFGTLQHQAAAALVDLGALPVGVDGSGRGVL